MEEPSYSPSELLCCRGCFATTVKLFDIHKNDLAETFEDVTGIPVEPKDGLPQLLCGTCCSLLAKSAAFRERCRRAQHCLLTRDQRELTIDYIKSIDRLSHGLVFSLTLTQVKIIEMGNSTQRKIKREPSAEDSDYEAVNFERKIEIEAVFSSEVKNEVNQLDVDNTMQSTTGFVGCKADAIDQTVDAIQEAKALAPTVKVTVKKPVKHKERNVRKIVEQNKELTKNQKVRKKIVKEKKTQKDVQKTPEVTYGCPKTDYLLKSLKDDKPIFNFAKIENTYNVDIKVLTMEQQLADWEQCNAPKKKPASYRCEECGKGYEQQDTYNNHMLRHNPSVGAHACAVCRVRFALKSKLRQHERRHALQLACRECGFVSRCRPQAKMHFNTHSGLKFECKQCDKSFTKRSSFLSHVRLVHATQSVACGECGEAFVSQLGLALHQARMHKVQKAASKCACPVCKVVFDSEEALATHTLASSGDGCDATVRPCPVCGESQPTEETLLKHTEERHTEQFKCSECPLTFPLAASRDVHYRRVHLNVRKIKNKRAPPAGPASRGRPRGAGATLCETCGKHCQTTTQLAGHRLTHRGEKAFACTDCDQRFVNRANLRRHQTVVHLGERPQVKCEECGKRLGAASLATHVRAVHRKIPPQRPRARRTDT